MMRIRKPSKASRRAALAAILDGLPDPPELPPEVSMLEDGKRLVGREWIKPQDFATDEVARGELGSMKGCTPLTLPTLDDPPTELGSPPSPDGGGGSPNLPN